MTMTDRSEAGKVPAVPARPPGMSIPDGFQARLSHSVASWSHDQVLIGGSPWRISRLVPAVTDIVQRMKRAGPAGIAVHGPRERAAVRAMLDRGFAEPVAVGSAMDEVNQLTEFDVVIPVYQDGEALAAALAPIMQARSGARADARSTPPSAGGVFVVDDGSPEALPIAQAARSAGARLVRHPVNQGPGAARNSGVAQGSAPLIAFVDADCVVGPDWPGSLLHHFDDLAVAAVAPRVLPLPGGRSLLERYEQVRSSLDMGSRAEVVRPGARLGFVPSAALLVRRSVIESSGFDPSLRVGEDVDLVWRVADAGWLVRYDPSVIVRHRSRTRPTQWLRRKVQYGSSAPALQARHPGRLAPARISLTSLSTLALIALGRPLAAAIPVGVGYLALARQLSGVPQGPVLAARTLGLGLVADAQSIGRALRREWWPLGAVALAAAPRSRMARVATSCMLAPLVAEWAQLKPPIDPVRYLAMRLVDDAAYGTGVLAASLGARSRGTLLPTVSMPKVPVPKVSVPGRKSVSAGPERIRRQPGLAPRPGSPSTYRQAWSWLGRHGLRPGRRSFLLR